MLNEYRFTQEKIVNICHPGIWMDSDIVDSNIKLSNWIRLFKFGVSIIYVRDFE